LLSAYAISTPIRRIRTACCARAATGQADKAAIPCINLRRRIAFARGQDYATTPPLHQAIVPGEMGFSDHFAEQQSETANVRFGSKATLSTPPGHVRSHPVSDRNSDIPNGR
jgi:hypothetical protein